MVQYLRFREESAPWAGLKVHPSAGKFPPFFQVADFVCTMRRLAFKLQINGKLAKSEMLFFGSVGNFRKIWLKPLLKCECP